MNNRKFSDEEFGIMVNQVLGTPASYDMLLHIARVTLFKPITKHYYNDEVLCPLNQVEDLFHDVLIKLIQITKTSFLLNDRAVNGVNWDPDGFKNWMFTVAFNEINKKYTEEKSRTVPTVPLDERKENTIPDVFSLIEDINFDETSDDRKRLQKAFSIILDSNSNAHIAITWLMANTIILCTNYSKIYTNHIIDTMFSDKSLESIYKLFKVLLKRIQWLSITEEQDKRMQEKLKKKYKNKTFGDIKLKELYMRNKKSVDTISAWVSRLNKMVVEKTK